MVKDEWYWGLDPLIRKNMEQAEQFEKEGGGLVGDIDWYEEEEIPEGCLACGGDFPLCKQGCPLFDDE